MSLTSQGAGGALSSPSPKSSREFKHKPICERIFCLSVIHFSVGLPSQTSGVLLAFKLACVSIRRTDRLSIVKGMRCCCCFLFFFLAFLLWGGGTIAIFTDALGTHQHRDITTTGCRPSDTFKRRERLAFFSQVIHRHFCIPLLAVFPRSLVLFGKGLHRRFSF